VTARLRAFARFWYDVVVGDDWLVAVGVVAALALTWVLAAAGFAAWPILPIAAALLLPTSLWREARGRRGDERGKDRAGRS
jgi:hypothetical protein